MSCPTCGHTMEALAIRIDETAAFHWCSRCGTVRHGSADLVPKLVERCRRLEGLNEVSPMTWDQLRIAESIHKPGDRP